MNKIAIVIFIIIIFVIVYINIYYKTEHFDTSISVGKAITCTDNDPLGDGSGAIYRYVGNNRVAHYPDPPTADACDKTWSSPLRTSCAGVTIVKQVTSRNCSEQDENSTTNQPECPTCNCPSCDYPPCPPQRDCPSYSCPPQKECPSCNCPPPKDCPSCNCPPPNECPSCPSCPACNCPPQSKQCIIM